MENNNPTNHIVEADIKGFFDNVNQEWLMKFLAHRVEDKRIQRMVKRFLMAGVSEDGIAKLEQRIRFYFLLSKLKGFDVVQLINERPPKRHLL